MRLSTRQLDEMSSRARALLGSWVLLSIVWVFNLPGLADNVSGWAHWLRWVARHHWAILGLGLLLWLIVSAWFVFEVRKRPPSTPDQAQIEQYLKLGAMREQFAAGGIGMEPRDVMPGQISFKLRSRPRGSTLARAAAGGEVGVLMRRGEQLLGEVDALEKPLDPHTARYTPMEALSLHAARGFRYSLDSQGSPNVWLRDTARFVSEHAPGWSSQVYPDRVRDLKAERLAVKENLAVLGEIANGILTPPLTPVEARAATALTAQHDQAVLSAYRDILQAGRELLGEFGKTQKARQEASEDMRGRAEAWFKRCGEWASGSLTTGQIARLGFEGAPRDSTSTASYFGLILRYLNALEAAGQELGL